MKTYEHNDSISLNYYSHAKIKTQILCSRTFFPENRDVYEIMCKNTVEPDMLQMTIYCACAFHTGCLRLQTHIQNMQFVLLSPGQQRLHKGASCISCDVRNTCKIRFFYTRADVTTYTTRRIRDARSGVWIPTGEQIFLFSIRPDGLWGPASLLFNG